VAEARFFYRAVVVAVVAVGVMEMSVDQVIDVVAMGDGGVTAVGVRGCDRPASILD
jgi:hypothetical protein